MAQTLRPDGGSDFNLRGVLVTSIALMIVAVLVQVLMLVVFRYFDARESTRAPRRYPLAGTETQLPPQPRIQANPAEDLNDLRLKDETVLTSYGWINQQAGVARIPIERAMKLVLERGLPVRSNAPPENDAPQPSDASSGQTMERTR